MGHKYGDEIGELTIEVKKTFDAVRAIIETEYEMVAKMKKDMLSCIDNIEILVKNEGKESPESKDAARNSAKELLRMRNMAFDALMSQIAINKLCDTEKSQTLYDTYHKLSLAIKDEPVPMDEMEKDIHEIIEKFEECLVLKYSTKGS